MRKTMRFTIMSYGDESMSYHCKKYTSNILLCPSTLSSILEDRIINFLINITAWTRKMKLL